MNTSSLKEQQQRKIKTQPGFFAALDQPEEDNFYADCIKHPNVLKVVALSGGYSPKEANERLRRNHGLIASFSRALLDGLLLQQSDEEYDAVLDAAIQSIYEASNT
jgi:fructose-bisphosphate aldolase class I